MSEQALETVHRVYEAFNERDIGRLLECLDPDFEIDGLVLVPLVLSARAKESGEQGEAQTTHLWTVRDAKATRLRVFADEATAREVAQRELAARDGRERR